MAKFMASHLVHRQPLVAPRRAANNYVTPWVLKAARAFEQARPWAQRRLAVLLGA